jgi:septal ring factor EnvC (AmiA/AmiB activator)
MANTSTQQLLSQLTELELHVSRLKARMFKLEVENKALQDKIFDHLKTISEQKKELQAGKDVLAAHQLSSQENRDLNVLTKKTLDKYIKLVDKLIAELQD